MHPKDVNLPEQIELDEFGDREQGGELYEYVRFVTTTPDADLEDVDAFRKFLREEFSGWTIAGGGNEDGELTLEMRRVIHNVEDEPPIPDEVLEEQREKEAEYYQEGYESGE